MIGESDPEGCAACQGPSLGYRNGTMYSSYTAAVFARKHLLAAQHGVNLEGALTWAFEFEDQPYFAGFRALASNGIDLPVLNVFRMFAKMRGQRVATESSARDPARADRDERRARAGPTSAHSRARTTRRSPCSCGTTMTTTSPVRTRRSRSRSRGSRSGGIRLTHYRIDETHSNAYAAWRRMGTPIAPNDTQYQELLEASKLARVEPPTPVRGESGETVMQFTLPRQGVSLIVVEKMR